MENLKQWVALTVVACMGIMAAGWFLLVSPKRTEAAELREQAASALGQNAQLETQLQVLKAQAKDLPKEQAKLAAVKTKIPDDPAMPTLIRALLEAADSSGIELVSITPGEPQLVAAPAPAAPEAPATGQVGPADPATPPDGAVAPAADGSTPEAAAPAAGGTPPAGPAGVLANIPVSLEVFGDYFAVQQFVAALEQLPRAIRLTGLTVAPGSSPTSKTPANPDDGRSLTTSIEGLVFMAAQRPEAVTATVPVDGTAPDAAVDAAAATADSAE